MISKRTIEKVFETALVEEVIGDFVQLKKSGSNYKGLSPFTEERTPSFMVSPAKQIWKDFSSGKGGTVITFLMEHEQYTYPEAIRYIANKYNIEVEETLRTPEQVSDDNEKESLFLVSEYAKNYFKKNLFSDEGKTVALSYLKERKFDDEVIGKFEIGYSFLISLCKLLQVGSQMSWTSHAIIATKAVAYLFPDQDAASMASSVVSDGSIQQTFNTLAETLKNGRCGCRPCA